MSKYPYYVEKLVVAVVIFNIISGDQQMLLYVL